MNEQQLEELKDYAVREVSVRRCSDDGLFYYDKHYTLHRKGECSCTTLSFCSHCDFPYSYDTYEEAKNAHPDLQYCRHCKTILEKIKEESKEYIVCEKMITVEKICF